MRIPVATGLVFVIAVTGCEAPTESSVGDATAQSTPSFDEHPPPSRPFFGTFAGEARFDPPGAPIRALFEGRGRATHLGATASTGVLAPLDFVPVPECDLGVGIPHTHMETLTAANGDRLLLELIDLACPVDQTFLRFRGTGHWTVVGGSGRFADASGSGTAMGRGDFIEGVFEFSVDGEIAY